MTIKKQIAVVTMLGAISAMAMTTQASAQISAARAKAIMVCIERAQSAYPVRVAGGHHGRGEVYAACMTEAGPVAVVNYQMGWDFHGPRYAAGSIKCPRGCREYRVFSHRRR